MPCRTALSDRKPCRTGLLSDRLSELSAVARKPDLAFTNIPLASAKVEEHLATSSDHFTVSINIPDISLQPRPTGRPQLRTPEDVKCFQGLVDVTGLYPLW